MFQTIEPKTRVLFDMHITGFICPQSNIIINFSIFLGKHNKPTFRDPRDLKLLCKQIATNLEDLQLH